MHRSASQVEFALPALFFCVAEGGQCQVINMYQTLALYKSSGARKPPARSSVALAEMLQFLVLGYQPCKRWKGNLSTCQLSIEMNQQFHEQGKYMWFPIDLRFGSLRVNEVVVLNFFCTWDIYNTSFFFADSLKVAEVNLSVLSSVWMGSNAWGILSSTRLSSWDFFWNWYCICIIYGWK